MSTLVCPKCKYQTEQNEAFCCKCGTKMIPAQEKMLCRSCGAEMKQAADFCSQCGAKQRTKKKTKEIGWSGLIFICMLVGTAIYQAKHEKKTEPIGLNRFPETSPIEQRIQTIHEAAEHGDANAQYALACLYHDGKGVKQNTAEAVKWISKAADQEHAEAQLLLGYCYKNGDGVKQDDAEAAKWFR